ncbi:MAG: U32 family peptidase C-terminal domain-containing protein, partial [Clostridia bacterium]|nr:U32 family peptidase C-terminal domain-containing protein [Clostridia bacterium]
ITATLKNKFLRGQELDCLEAGSVPFKIVANELYNGENEPIESAPHPMMTIKIPYERPIKIGSMLRMKSE